MNYAGLSGIYDPIHLDKEHLADSEFGGRLLYGQLVHVVMEGLKIQTGILADSVIASYGMDSVPVVNPVLIGDTIHNEIQVINLGRRDADSGSPSEKKRGVTNSQKLSALPRRER
ncbi:MaoC/PaaZ C-terminal domain-containing protein [Natrinema halophilum]|uniref:MaoC-like domain-containing protein n=1 Tax=Natrinema halophilum TaxID=1699371 RepID=A0A7D5H9Z6_9EURY